MKLLIEDPAGIDGGFSSGELFTSNQSHIVFTYSGLCILKMLG